MIFETPTNPPRQAYLRVNLQILREMLRLPKDVTITGVRDLGGIECEVMIAGPSLPADGELVAEYTFQNITHVTFQGFKKP